MLEKSISKKIAKENEGNYVLAHRHWLNHFVEEKINPKTYACDPSVIPEGRSLLDIVSTLKKGSS